MNSDEFEEIRVQVRRLKSLGDVSYPWRTSTMEGLLAAIDEQDKTIEAMRAVCEAADAWTKWSGSVDDPEAADALYEAIERWREVRR